MEYQLKIDKELDVKINNICYMYINQWTEDLLLNDYDIAVFCMYIENKLLNLREGKEIDSVVPKRSLKSHYI